MIPASGSIIFDSQSANSSVISPLSSAPRLSYDNGGGLNITSYTTGTTTLDRFSVDGSAGRLFSISDSLTGTIFSVNDAAGLPIIQVDSDTTDIVNIGPYGTSTFVTSGTSVGIGTAAPISKLHIVDRVLAATGGLSGSILNLEQTWNTTGTPTAIKLNVTDTASNAASNLIDLQISGVSKFSVRKDGRINIFGDSNTYISQLSLVGQALQNSLYISAPQYIGLNSPSVALMNGGTRAGWWNRDQGIIITSNNYYGFSSSSTDAGTSADTILLRDGASNTLALRNGVNPQAFRLYNTYTSGTHFERLNLRWDNNVLRLGTEKGSAGGTTRPLSLEIDNVSKMSISSDSVYIGTPLNVGGNIELPEGAGIIFTDQGYRYLLKVNFQGQVSISFLSSPD